VKPDADPGQAMAQQVELLVLQPTPFCNIDCRYCYLPHRTDRSRMRLGVAALVGRRLIQRPWACDRLTILWHAGEPLVLPPAYYEQVFRVLARTAATDIELKYALQTNGTLIDAKWVDFFHRWNVQVGLSLDGPRELHDAARVDRAGRGTFAATWSGLRRLVEAEVPVSVITVLTERSLDQADALFAFYLENGIRSVGFNVEEIEGNNGSSSLMRPGTAERLRGFLQRFWELAEANPGLLHVREFDGAATAILNPEAERFGNPLVTPLRIVTVDAAGAMSTFAPELLGTDHPGYNGFTFGNIRDGGYERMLSHPAFHKVWSAIAAGVDACRETCAHFPLCRGGSPANKLFETARLEATETLYCRLARKMVLDVVLEALERGAAHAGTRRSPGANHAAT
jgi:uncharacterized protein